jgi:hypothetical protein
MGIVKATREARIKQNKSKATEKYGSDVGAKFSSENYDADEKSILASENEGKRMFNGKGVYAKAGKDEKFTMDEGTTLGKGTASERDSTAGLFANKRQKLFS